jgi:hypothetical protein
MFCAMSWVQNVKSAVAARVERRNEQRYVGMGGHGKEKSKAEKMVFPISSSLLLSLLD